MSDIVERLREEAEGARRLLERVGIDEPYESLFTDAADEIERLRGIIALSAKAHHEADLPEAYHVLYWADHGHSKGQHLEDWLPMEAENDGECGMGSDVHLRA